MKQECSAESTAEAFTLRVPGDLVSTTVSGVRAKAACLLDAPRRAAAPWRKFVLDLTAANLVDSTGLNLMISMGKAMKQSGGVMEVLYTSVDLERVFYFTHLHELVDLKKVC